MKRTIALLALFISFQAKAQSAQETDSAARQLISDLIAYWTLGVDSNSSTVNINEFNKYKDLFAENAKVDDDLRIRFIPGNNTGNYIIQSISKDFDEYAHDVALEINNLRIDSVSQPIRASRNDSEIYEIKRTVFIEKPARYILTDVDALADAMIARHTDIVFEKKNEKAQAASKEELRNRLKTKLAEHPDSVYRFRNTSTLRIAMVPGGELSDPLKIGSIQNVSNDLKCINDQDLDGLPDSSDVNPGSPGEFSANGAPDADLDGVSDAGDYCKHAYGSSDNHGCPVSFFMRNQQLDGGLGIQFNTAEILLPELNQLGYKDASGADAMDVLQSSQGSLKSSTPSTGVYAGGNYAYFFGKNARHTGISIGVNFSRFITNYDMIDPIVYTYKASDGSDDYRRQISVNSLTEKITYAAFNFPLQFNYRFKFGAGKSWAMLLRGGPSLLALSGSTNYDASISVGGIYQIDTVTKDRITYYDFFDKGSTWNVYLTSNGIDQQNSNSSAAAVFEDLQRAGGYDFISNKEYRGEKKLSRITYALNFSFDVLYKKNKESPISLKAGGHLIYGPSTGSQEKYKIIDQTASEYNSIFNSNGKSYYFAYGMSVGLVYDF